MALGGMFSDAQRRRTSRPSDGMGNGGYPRLLHHPDAAHGWVVPINLVSVGRVDPVAVGDSVVGFPTIRDIQTLRLRFRARDVTRVFFPWVDAIHRYKIFG
jgi:hypothetical protein